MRAATIHNLAHHRGADVIADHCYRHAVENVRRFLP
jgi:hypothetical protein